MALRDQPYLPLYVQDYLTDEKLSMCTWSTQGVYIKILCLLHKSEPYGSILLKQNDKQTQNVALNFAIKITKLLPIDRDTLYGAIKELVEEGCLTIDGDKLFQKRMVRDNDISIKRANAGKEGGLKTQFAKAKNKANYRANSENENENENINIDFSVFWDLYDKKVGDKQKCEKKWNSLKPEERQKIIDTLPAFKASISDKQFQPYPETYLNKKRWNDEIKKPGKYDGMVF